MPRSHRLAEGTWEDAGDALASADYVALPAGSLEQHSYHLPLSTDAIEAERLVDELAERAPDHGLEVVSLPTLPYGYSEHHMNFPGTVTLAADTYQEVIVEIGDSLARHGAERFLILNHHGGNREPLALAADRLQREHGIRTHAVLPPFLDFASEGITEKFGEGWGHAGDYETSMIEHYAPELVKDGEKKPQETEAIPETRPYAYFDDITEGGLGDPTNSDPEWIAGFVDEMIDGLLERLAEER